MSLPVPLLGARRPSPRGQTLALAAVSMLVLALMLMLSFNLSQALHEKIRLQQHSDALAYSMAIVEARSFNYYAASNRAQAAAFSAMNSIHAYHAAASVTADMMSAGQHNMVMIAIVYELGVHKAWCCYPGCVAGCPHVPHLIGALGKASKYGDASSKYGKKVKGLESSFNAVILSLEQMVNDIHRSQLAIYKDTVDAVRSGSSSELDRIRKQNAPRSNKLKDAVGALNAIEYICAIDGMPCAGRAGTTDPTTHAKLMTEIVNATRTKWAANREGMGLGQLSPMFLKELMKDIPNPGASLPTSLVGTAKTIENATQSELESGSSPSDTGKVIGADEHGGTLITYYVHKSDIWATGYKAEVYSSASGGKHTPGAAHSGQHKSFTGVKSEKTGLPCSFEGDCFMKFRADSQHKPEFGQPNVYSYVTQTLRWGNVQKGPWELNKDARVRFKDGEQGTGTVELAAKEGAGFSKAFVYYHRLGDWTEHPNFFNPYWRAKLNAFFPKEAEKVLTAAGNSDAVQLSTYDDMPM